MFRYFYSHEGINIYKINKVRNFLGLHYVFSED